MYRNKLDKAGFAYDAAYSDSKDLLRRTISDNNLKDSAYQRALASMVYKVFNQKTGSGASVNKELPQELHKPVIKKFKRRKGYARFKDNNCAADLAEIGSLSSKIHGVKYLLFVVHVFIKYAWVKPLKDEKGKTVLNGFIEIVNENN